MSKSLRLLCGVFVASGFCGLIYQSIWTHYLKLFLGHAAYAQTLVLIVFIGGMAGGAWLAGRFGAALANPLLGYAAIEFAIGLAAIGFHGLYQGVTDWSYATLLPLACGSDGWCAAQWLVGAAMILPQSLLLGATFPLMSAAVLRMDPQLPGRKLALLYFLNSIGAAAGVLASGFLLIPAFGLPGTQMTAGIGNVVIALVAWSIARRAHLPVREFAANRHVSLGVAAYRDEAVVLLAVAALTGLSSFVYEIVWTRMLSMVLGSSTHSFEVMLASFILGLALGGFWIRKRIDTTPNAVYLLGIVQVAMGVFALLTLPVYDQTFDATAWLLGALSKSAGGYALFTIAGTLIAMAVMLPATVLAGMTLPLITYRMLRIGAGEGAIGKVYSVNTLGGIVGVVVAVHVGLPMLGLKASLLLAAAIDMVLGAWLLLRFAGPGQARLSRGIAMAGIATLPVASLAFHLDPAKVASGVFRHGRATLDPATKVLFQRDGKTSTVHVLVYPDGRVSINTNGKSDGAIAIGDASGRPSEDEATMVLLGALPLAHHPQARSVAMIGFGTGMSTATVLGSPRVERVETIEIEPAMVEGARVYHDVVGRAFDDPRSRIVIEDAKSHFARGQRRYDVIVSEPSNPWVSGVSSLFTEEFYRRVRGHLAPDGIFAQWVHIYELDLTTVASIEAAFRSSFPSYRVYAANHGDLVFVAGADPRRELTLDASVFEMPGVAAMLERVGIRTPGQLAMRFVGSERTVGRLLAATRTPANSDFFPTVDLRAPKARFLGAYTGEVFGLYQAAVPIAEVLERGAAPSADAVWVDADPASSAARERDRVGARTILEYLSAPAGTHVAGAWPPNVLALRPAAQILRAGLVDCSAGVEPEAIADAALALASATISSAPQSHAAPVWTQLARGPCAATQPDFLRQWLALYAAVAGRDGPALTQRSAALLSGRPAPGGAALEYVVAAGVFGAQLARRPDRGSQIWRLAEPRLGADPAAWPARLRLLAAMTAGGTTIGALADADAMAQP